MPGFEPPLRFDKEEPLYTKSKWTYEELLGEVVRYELDDLIPGTGWFAVARDPDSDRLAIRIKVIVPDETKPTRLAEITYSLPQRYVDLIKLNPERATAVPTHPKFLLLASPSQDSTTQAS